MSLRAMLWVLDDADIPDNDTSVLCCLVALADDADDDGLCWPGMRRIAARARMSVNGARKALQRAEDAGLVIVERPEKQGRGKHNRYWLAMPERGSGAERRGNGVDPSDFGNAREGSTGVTPLGEETRAKGPLQSARTRNPRTDTRGRGFENVENMVAVQPPPFVAENAGDPAAALNGLRKARGKT